MSPSLAARAVCELPPAVLAAEALVHERGLDHQAAAHFLGLGIPDLRALLNVGREARMALAAARLAVGTSLEAPAPRPPTRDEQCVLHALDGLNAGEIAAEMGVLPGTVYGILSRARARGERIPVIRSNAARPPEPRKPLPPRQGTAADILELAKRGLRPLEISERLGWAPGSISKVLCAARRSGVPVPRFPGCYRRPEVSAVG